MGATNPNAGGAPGGGGKGGMGMNRGPGGNAQNNPGGYPPGMSPMQGWANMNKLGQTPNFGGNKPALGGGLDTSGMTPISANLTPPTPQPQEPVGGYINGQPAQWHYQAEALKKPPVNSVGLPTGGILAKLYGG